MLLLKNNKDIAPKDKMRFIINLWNEKKAILQDKYPDYNGLKYGSMGISNVIKMTKTIFCHIYPST